MQISDVVDLYTHAHIAMMPPILLFGGYSSLYCMKKKKHVFIVM
jgi:hypothetical protein